MTSVMIVDDISFFRQLVRAVVEREPEFFVVAEAGTGREAVDCYEMLKPDVVTLDLMLPDIDGIAVLKEIRQMDPFARVVAISAVNDVTRQNDLLRAGARRVLQKPINPSQLLEAIRNACSEEEPTSAPVQMVKPGSENRKGKVLLADDDPLYLRIASHILQQHGYDVVEMVQQGDLVIEAFARHLPEFVLLDYDMPGANGLWALRHLTDISPHAKVFLVTATLDNDVQVKAHQSGAAGYLPKPLDYNHLIELMEENSPEDDPPSGHEPRSDGHDGPPGVLVVEDEPVTQKVLGRVVTAAGASLVGSATTPQGGLRLYREHRPQLVLLDLELVAGSGLDLLAEIRTTDPDTPVIIVTGNAQKETVAAAMAFGVTGYIIKPFDLAHAVKSVRRVLRL